MRNSNSRSITIYEFQSIFIDQRIDNVLVDKEDIAELKTFIDEQNSDIRSSKSSLHEFLIPIRNGVQANNYVGVLQTKSGLTIEILPKIYGSSKNAEDKDVIRKLFLTMLKTVRRLDGKKYNMTHLNTQRSNLLEVFISMFLSETDHIIKNGLKSSYVAIRSNEKFLKGKLIISEQVRRNRINQSHFYSEFDEYQINIPENQLIRTTLEYLLHVSSDNSNLRIIRQQMSYFDLVDETHLPELTFQKVELGRNYQYYSQALEWCRIFLSRQTFTSFRGSTLAFAILFPMEKIFESFVSSTVEKIFTGCNVSMQDRSYTLFDKTTETDAAYGLRPDLVIRYGDNRTTIADTKWKILDEKGPSQGDLYQMYAYYTRYHHKKEDVDKVILIYPLSTRHPERKFVSLIEDAEDLAANIQVKYIDLLSDDVVQEIKQIFF